MTAFRTGTNKLRIETGRWEQPVEPESKRLCRVCVSGEIENEKHFIMYCPAYADLRNQMFEKMSEV